MRGADAYSEALFTTVKLEDFVLANHPLRPIRKWINEALAKMDAKFSAMYEADIKGGRHSIAPEKLMRAMLLQVLYSVRSERQLVEQIQYNLLFRLVRRSGHRGHRLESLRVQQEPRPAHRARRRDGTVQRDGRDGRQVRTALGGALQRGRHAYPGLGQPQEHAAQGRIGRRPCA